MIAWDRRSHRRRSASLRPVDAGISGAKGRDQRPGFDAMMKAATRREFDLVAAWSVDRLGRSLQHGVHAGPAVMQIVGNAATLEEAQ